MVTFRFTKNTTQDFIIFQWTQSKSHTSIPNSGNLVLRVAHTVAIAPGPWRGVGGRQAEMWGFTMACQWVLWRQTLCLHAKHIRIVSTSSGNSLSPSFSFLICVLFANFSFYFPSALPSPSLLSLFPTQFQFKPLLFSV